jgi:diguanylate cyclase (GGDEF)-like protein
MGIKNKNVNHRQDTTGQQPFEVNEPGSSSGSAAVNIHIEQEPAVQTHEHAVLSSEEADDLREKVAELAAKAREEHSADTEAQLREANEHLVVAAIRAQTNADAAEQTTVQMTHMAEHDFLTGLPNRMLLTNRLAQAISLAQRHGKKVALMYLDLDHFKQINDTLGHDVGDQLLQSAAKRLQACVRFSDTVSRQGGDEFVVLLAEVEDARGAVLTAEKLTEAMAAPHLIGNHRLQVTLSIGISLYPDDARDTEAMFKNADIALYHVKKSGRNNHQLFTPDMNVHTVERQAIEEGLQLALQQSGFVLHYQPKVNIETGAITGAEALLRWQRSNHRLVGPAQFMSIAEDCGLVLQIGQWVLSEACLQAQTWLQAGLELGQIAVNVSAKEMLGKHFLADVRTILSDTGLEPHRLEIELTERGLMGDRQHTMAILQALKELGVRIAIDDFGIGYSSLSNLWSFPIDTLKIDQSCVQDIDSAPGKAIVSTIIAMGRSLKQRVVAEGIESRRQLDFLQEHLCAEGQGYYFGRPVVAEKFAGLLQ